jgi:AAA domain
VVGRLLPQADGSGVQGVNAAAQTGPQSAISVTFFLDQSANRKREERLTPEQLAARINRVSQPSKERLPWLKCARFGEVRTDRNSLRHDANVCAITGIEGDYDAKPNHDGGVISFEEAVARVSNAGISAIIYTSPSFTEDLHKYRVLCPLSAEHPPEDRDRYMARLNGMFDGAFASESWTLSQSYYFGSVNQNPSHRVEVIEGVCIDDADYLDATAIGRPERLSRSNGNGQYHPAARPDQITDRRLRGLVESLLDHIRNAPEGEKHNTLNRIGFVLGGYLHLLGWSVEQAASTLVDALPDTVKDWNAARTTARKSVEAGMEQPLDLAERPNPKAQAPDPEPRAEPQPEPAPEPPKPSRILTGATFIASYVPPDWLIDGIIQRGRLYACTSLTGHGKTAVWSFNGCMVHAGGKIGNLEVCQGNVLYLAGENPEDLKARMIGLLNTYSISDDQLPYVLPGNFPFNEDEAQRLKRDIADLGVPFSLIIGDTASSFFPGDDENDNVQAGGYARTLRAFTQECAGNPAVVALCHPIKNATRNTLLPRGGGAFVNELDGNTTLWSNSLGEVTELHWFGKIRGPDFSALGYRLKPADTGFKDRRDRPVMTIVAEPMSDEAVATLTKESLDNENRVLWALKNHPGASMGKIAEHLGWMTDGKPDRWKVQRAMDTLNEDKLVHQTRKKGSWKLTEKGEEALKGDNQ